MRRRCHNIAFLITKWGLCFLIWQSCQDNRIWAAGWCQPPAILGDGSLGGSSGPSLFKDAGQNTWSIGQRQGQDRPALQDPQPRQQQGDRAQDHPRSWRERALVSSCHSTLFYGISETPALAGRSLYMDPRSGARDARKLISCPRAHRDSLAGESWINLPQPALHICSFRFSESRTGKHVMSIL